MLSLVEVRCPHCGAKGQIVMPPLGAIIIGPCPKCEELLIVFCGQVLPLEKGIVMHGTPREKHDHLMSVLTEFLEDRVADLVRQTTPEHQEDGEDEYLDLDAEEETEADVEGIVPEFVKRISENEVEQFIKIDLNLLDNRDYFKAVFG